MSNAAKILTKREIAKVKSAESYRVWVSEFRPKLEQSTAANFLGGNRNPFPLNKSFTVPPTISEEIKENVLREAEQNTLLKLSRKYGISVKRIEAIRTLSRLKLDMISKVPTI